MFPNASFDDFVSGFVDDVRSLINPAFALSKIDGSKFDRLLDALSQYGISPSLSSLRKTYMTITGCCVMMWPIA